MEASSGNLEASLVSPETVEAFSKTVQLSDTVFLNFPNHLSWLPYHHWCCVILSLMLHFCDIKNWIIRSRVQGSKGPKGPGSKGPKGHKVLEVFRGVLSCLGSVLTPFWSRLEASWAVLETSWNPQNRSKISLGGISYRKNKFAKDWSPSDQGSPHTFEGCWMSKAVKMEPNLIENWYKNMTSNKDSFINSYGQVFERNLRPKASTFLVYGKATRNII